MIVQKYSHFLFLIFALIKYVFSNDFKQFVDLEENYNDISADNGVIPDDESSNNITYICGTNIKNDCECKNNKIECVLWFKDANVKPFDESIEIREASFSMGNITALKRDKILPDNEDTIERLAFTSVGLKFIEDGAFDKFISLTFLNLQDNEMTSINEKVLTPELGSSLKSLRISHNKFTILNLMAFKNLKALNSLFLGWNPLSVLTDIFPKLNVEILAFTYCGIKVFEENVFMNLPNLRYLLLEGNNFSSIPTAIKHLPNLYQIELGVNLLTKIESNAFTTNSKLEYIILHNNPLLVVDDCAFCGLPFLKWVLLHSCHQLSSIHENAFGSISTGVAPSLEYFTVNECNLTILSEELLDWKNTDILNIGGNPFTCNCSMAWLFRDLSSRSSLYNKKIKRQYHGHKYILGCFPPLDALHKHFLRPVNVSEIFEPCKIDTSSARLIWVVFFMVISMFIATILIYVYRQQVNSLFVLHLTKFRSRSFMQMNE